MCAVWSQSYLLLLVILNRVLPRVVRQITIIHNRKPSVLQKLFLRRVGLTSLRVAMPPKQLRRKLNRRSWTDDPPNYSLHLLWSKVTKCSNLTREIKSSKNCSIIRKTTGASWASTNKNRVRRSFETTSTRLTQVLRPNYDGTTIPTLAAI